MPGAKRKSDTQVVRDVKKQQGPKMMEDGTVSRRSHVLGSEAVRTGAYTGMNKSDAAKRLNKLSAKSDSIDADLEALKKPAAARKELSRAKKDSAAAMKRLRKGK